MRNDNIGCLAPLLVMACFGLVFLFAYNAIMYVGWPIGLAILGWTIFFAPSGEIRLIAVTRRMLANTIRNRRPEYENVADWLDQQAENRDRKITAATGAVIIVLSTLFNAAEPDSPGRKVAFSAFGIGLSEDKAAMLAIKKCEYAITNRIHYRLMQAGGGTSQPIKTDVGNFGPSSFSSGRRIFSITGTATSDFMLVSSRAISKPFECHGQIDMNDDGEIDANVTKLIYDFDF